MKKVIAWLLVLALTAAVSIGATLAYLTDTDEDVNVMTLGKVKIDQLEYERIDVESKDDDAEVQEFHDNKPLLPVVADKDFNYTPGTSYVDWVQIGKDGYNSDIWNPTKINNEVDKMVFVKNKGDYDAYVRSVFAFEAGKYTTLDEFQKMVHLNLNETDYTWEWVQTPVTIGESTYFVATATYNKVLAPGALTEISLSQIALDKTATNEDVEAFGETYQVLVKSQGIQADGFEDPIFALNEGFGKITAQNIPWENDTPTTGTDLYSALHYLDGDTTRTKITAKVSNVVFGLNEGYESITDNYTGTLVDVEQDVPVYAYYVPNGSNYDVYVLANDTIYTPKNSNDLMRSMSALKTVDTSNLDVSRTESMSAMLRDCTSLTSIDVSDWDTGNVTNMDHLFRNCKALTSVDTSKWDTHNVTSMLATFQDCKAMTEIYVADWDTSKVTVMTQMFNRCTNLSSINVSGWDTGKVTIMYLMFAGCQELTSLDVSDWDVSSVENFGHMFTNYTGGSYYDMKLSSLAVSGWNTGSATSMECMFYGCGRLTSLDLSRWDVSKVETMNHMFTDCGGLVELNLKGWDTSSLEVMDCMFNDCDGLVTLDVSDFDTHNVKEFCQVFESCDKLEQIIGLNKWDTSSGCTFEEMFAACGALKELDLSSFDTRNARDKFKASTDTYDAFKRMFSAANNLQTLTLGANFDFNGNSDSNNPVVLPAPAPIDGQATKWYNEANGIYYTASEIPESEDDAVTYVAAIPSANP